MKKIIVAALIATLATTPVHASTVTELNGVRLTAGVETVLNSKPETTKVSVSDVGGNVSIDQRLVSKFMDNDIEPVKAVALATLWEKLNSRSDLSFNVKIGLMAQALAEGNPGQFEMCGDDPTTDSYKHWHSVHVDPNYRYLAGTSINSAAILCDAASISSKAKVGCGMMQWTGVRRKELFEHYASVGNDDYISPYDFAAVEADFVCDELDTPYFKRIVKWSKGKDFDTTVNICTVVYAGQTSSEESTARLEKAYKIKEIMQSLYL